MKRYIFSTLAAGAFLVGSAWAQSSTPPDNPTRGSTPAENQRYEQRQENQADRIQQGVKSGNLTPKQGRELWRQNQRQQRDLKAMKKANGGNLSERQERHVARSMNRQSRRIYRAKH